jgi:hypothetical protein
MISRFIRRHQSANRSAAPPKPRFRDARKLGKTNRRHRAAQMRRAARGNRQRRKFSNRFQQSQFYFFRLEIE